MVNTETGDSKSKEIGNRIRKIVKGGWWSVGSYTISVALYCFDLASDIILGKEMLLHPKDNDGIDYQLQGAIILLIITLPMLATLGLVLFKYIFGKFNNKECLSRDPDYEHTLLGVDWLCEDDRDAGSLKWALKVGLTLALFLLRVDIFISYIELVIVQCRRKHWGREELKNEMEEWKKQERKLRGGMFIEACFEALPQCATQLYMFGERSTVSHLQVASFTLSVVTLCYTFVISQIKREVELYYKLGKRGCTSSCTIRKATSHGAEEADAAIHLDHCHELTEAVVTTSEQSTRFKIKSGHKSIAMTTKLKRNDTKHTPDKPPTQITLTLHLTAAHGSTETETSNTDDNNGEEQKTTYIVKNTEIKSKDKRNQKLFYFCVGLLNIVIGSPTFFFTAIPAVSLFSALFGVKFLFLSLPLLCHFSAEYWWWRPKTTVRNINASFHSLYLAFKLLLRLVILGCLCVWFIKVMSYYPSMSRSSSIHSLVNKSHSKPVNKSTCPEISSFHMPHIIITSFVWNKQSRKGNGFLIAVASYNKIKRTHDWETECCEEWARKPTNNGGWLERRNCAIDVAKYVFCVTFYMNIIGILWDIVVYILFMAFLLYSRAEKWTDATKTEECRDGVEEGTHFDVGWPTRLKRSIKKWQEGEEATQDGNEVIVQWKEDGRVDEDGNTSETTPLNI